MELEKPCEHQKIDIGIPGHPAFYCLEGCDNLMEILPIINPDDLMELPHAEK